MLKKYKVPLLLFVLAVISLALSRIVGTSVDAQGYLHEPAFFLVPIFYALLLASLISALYIKIRNKK